MILSGSYIHFTWQAEYFVSSIDCLVWVAFSLRVWRVQCQELNVRVGERRNVGVQECLHTPPSTFHTLLLPTRTKSPEMHRKIAQKLPLGGPSTLVYLLGNLFLEGLPAAATCSRIPIQI